MSDPKKESPFLLIGKYVQETISSEETDLLLSYMKENSEIAKILYKNIQADIWLQTIFQAEREAEDLPLSPLPEDLKENGSHTDPQSEIQKLLEEALAYEKNAVPVPKDPEEKDHNIAEDRPNSPLIARKSINRSRSNSNQTQKRKESILPLVLSFGLLVGLCGWLSIDHYRQTHKQPEDSFQALVKIEEVVDPVWKPGSSRYKRGQESGPNEFELDQGMFKLHFTTGAEVILEGPGKFVVSDSNKLFCSRGKISAYVPKSAAGFEIATASGRFIDRGTEFSVFVDPVGTSVEVYRGKVDASYMNAVPMNLETGNAVVCEKQGTIRTYASKEENYTSSAIFDQKVKEASDRLIQKKTGSAQKWDQDPTLLIHADLWNADAARSVENQAISGSVQIPAIQRVACSVGEGRFRGTKSLEFLRRNDRLEFKMQEEYSSLTLAVSVRIDRLSNTGNTLMMSRDFFQQAGAISFQIGKEGNLQFFISGDKKGKNQNPSIDKAVNTAIDIPSTFLRSDWGTWIQFAVVLDAKEKAIRIFKDGILLSNVPWPDPVPLVPGTVYFGNASEEKMSKNPKYLGGAIDEFYIFRRALNEQEIRTF
ncbi:MAG: LamG-like jellyroll fold domain-containing protein [Planctomycetia bacterium]|nr:LamG-like jellyroll fold domain-containing protein [Planctomycetia bacterium]